MFVTDLAVSTFIIFVITAALLFYLWYEMRVFVGKDLIKQWGWPRTILMYLLITIVFNAVWYFVDQLYFS